MLNTWKHFKHIQVISDNPNNSSLLDYEIKPNKNRGKESVTWMTQENLQLTCTCKEKREERKVNC